MEGGIPILSTGNLCNQNKISETKLCLLFKTHQKFKISFLCHHKFNKNYYEVKINLSWGNANLANIERTLVPKAQYQKEKSLWEIFLKRGRIEKRVWITGCILQKQGLHVVRINMGILWQIKEKMKIKSP